MLYPVELQVRMGTANIANIEGRAGGVNRTAKRAFFGKLPRCARHAASLAQRHFSASGKLYRRGKMDGRRRAARLSLVCGRFSNNSAPLGAHDH